jgi:hypothetical protein
MRTQYGATPSGGDSSYVSFFDADGGEVDGPDGAASAEVVETLDGAPIARHYLERGEPTPTTPDPGTAIAEPDVWDTTKDTWDIWVVEDGVYREVEAVADVLAALGLAAAPLAKQRETIAFMMTAPYWPDAPEAFRADASRWLVETRPGQPSA